MYTIEWNGTQWWLVEWKRSSFLTLTGRFRFALKSVREEDVLTETMLLGYNVTVCNKDCFGVASSA